MHTVYQLIWLIQYAGPLAISAKCVSFDRFPNTVCQNRKVYILERKLVRTSIRIDRLGPSDCLDHNVGLSSYRNTVQVWLKIEIRYTLRRCAPIINRTGFTPDHVVLASEAEEKLLIFSSPQRGTRSERYVPYSMRVNSIIPKICLCDWQWGIQ